MVNLKKIIADNKLSDDEIAKALEQLVLAKQKVAESQAATAPKESDAEAEESVAPEIKEPAQQPAPSKPEKEFFTQKELDDLIAKKVEEKLKASKIQDQQAFQTPTFVNKSPPPAYKVLKMK
jgi:hypothetical protein